MVLFSLPLSAPNSMSYFVFRYNFSFLDLSPHFLIAATQGHFDTHEDED